MDEITLETVREYFEDADQEYIAELLYQIVNFNYTPRELHNDIQNWIIERKDPI